MFHSTSVRLTLWYLSIIMLISLFFSLTLYGVLTDELDRGIRRQVVFFRGVRVNIDNDSLNDQLNASKRRIQLNLLYYNIVILIFAGAASYFLAKRTLRPIEKALTSQGQFTADASHELRTPLTAMKTEIEVALRDKGLTKEDTKQTLVSNLEEIKKLEDLSNALLALSKFEVGKQEIFEDLKLSLVVESAINSMKSVAKSKEISITSELIDTTIEAEESSLTSLIKIILDNAIKYSREKTTVAVSNKIENNYLLLSISDQGIGIKQSDLPFIFNRFFRSDNSRSKQKISGYGLGLAIAKKIVDSHHGKIEVESSAQGSTFTIKLPIKQPKNFLP